MKLLIHWVVSALVILAVAYILPGVSVAGFLVALIVALVLGLINAFIRPLVLFLTLPLNVLTFGLFTLVADTLLIMLGAWVVTGFDVANFWWALLFGVILSIISLFFKGSERSAGQMPQSSQQ